MSFQRILIALDRSPLAAEVFEQALNLAGRNESSLLLVHCLTLKTGEELGDLSNAEIGLPRQTQLHQFQQANLEKVGSVQQWLEYYSQRAVDQGIEAQFTCEVSDADAGSLICELAQSWNADLVAIGFRGESGLKEPVLGSVSHYVIRHAPCKVMVVQPGDDRDIALQYARSY